MNDLISQIYRVDNRIKLAIAEHTDFETGEISEEALNYLDRLELTKEELTKSCIAYYHECNSNVDVINAEIKRLQDLKDRFNSQADTIKKYITKQTPEGEKTNTPEYTISWRKSESLEVEPDINLESIEKTNPELIIIERKLDKTKAKQLVKNSGVSLPGIKLVTKNNIQIK